MEILFGARAMLQGITPILAVGLAMD